MGVHQAGDARRPELVRDACSSPSAGPRPNNELSLAVTEDGTCNGHEALGDGVIVRRNESYRARIDRDRAIAAHARNGRGAQIMFRLAA